MEKENERQQQKGKEQRGIAVDHEASPVSIASPTLTSL
jgi:hypothetical protein